MNAETVLQVTRHDVALVRRALRHLTAGQQILCGLAVLITAVVWWSLLSWLLAVGRGIDYSGLQFLGAKTVLLLQQYNPFFWWGLIALCTLLLIYLLAGFVAATQRSVRNKLVSQSLVQRLTQQLSAAGHQVLDWSWENRREPVTVGVLQQTLAEMRSGRAGKITLAHQHQTLLDAKKANADSLPLSTKYD